jgi:hypothetical protein
MTDLALQRYNVVPKFIDLPEVTWEYQADDNGEIIFADLALELIARLTAERDELRTRLSGDDNL